MKASRIVPVAMTVACACLVLVATPAAADSTGQYGTETLCGYNWNGSTFDQAGEHDIVTYQGPSRVYVDRPQWVRVRIDINQPIVTGFYGGWGPYWVSRWSGWEWSTVNNPAYFGNMRPWRVLYNPNLTSLGVFLDVQVYQNGRYPIKTWKTRVFNHYNRYGAVIDQWTDDGSCFSH